MFKLKKNLVVGPAIGLTFLLSACAGLEAGPVHDDQTARGFRYYQSAPFLFVRSNGQGGLAAEIKYLPDTTKKMSIRPYAYMANNESKLTFSGGMLTSASITADETAVISASLDALGKVLAASAAMDDRAPGAELTAPLPYLFKIVIQGDQIFLKGGPARDFDGKEMVIKVGVGKQKE